MNTMVIRGCGKQGLSALRQLAKEFPHLTLKDVMTGQKCRFLGIMRR